jgi:polyphosphate glucokinase
MNVLVIDVGGSHVKLALSGNADARRFDSAPDLSPTQLIQQVQTHTADWTYSVISLGIPALCGPHGPVAEPGNLGVGWNGFDFGKAFNRPVRVVNDAALQALGAYEGGRMLFVGLGTGLGSTLIVERVVIPLELGELHNLDGENREHFGIRLGKQSLEKLGEARWKQLAISALCMFKDAFFADYVVIGGGHASLIDPLPKGVRRGGNDDAFTGGFRLWEENVEPHDAPPSTAFRVVR